MKLGVVAALETEIRPTLKAFHPSGPDPADPFRFMVSGIGLTRAERTARSAEDVQGLLSVGFCGGLEDGLVPGDLILGGTREFEVSPDLLKIAQRAGPHRIGMVDTVDHVVNDTEEKRSIARTTGAIAVDMEAAGVGKVAKQKGLAFLCVKVVLDTPSHPLASSYASFGRVAIDILKRPWIVGRMIADGKRAGLAAQRLRDFFVAFAKELGP
jgi:nucleoside phosphorylase